MSMRRWMPAAFVLAMMVGCQESDPNKVNNSGITGVESKGGGGGAGGPGAGTANPPSGYPGSGQRPPAGDTAAPGGPDMTKPAGDAAETPATPAADAPKPEPAAPAGETPAADAPKVALEAAEIEEIKALPEGEQAIALAQAVCLVSGGHLGAMGTPIKVEHDGKIGYLCCAGCKGDFDAEPAKFAAKMTAAPK